MKILFIIVLLVITFITVVQFLEGKLSLDALCIITAIAAGSGLVSASLDDKK